MSFPTWALVIGALLIIMALVGSLLKRLPVSASMLYLAVGYGLVTADWGPMVPEPQRDSACLPEPMMMAIGKMEIIVKMVIDNTIMVIMVLVVEETVATVIGIVE